MVEIEFPTSDFHKSFDFFVRQNFITPSKHLLNFQKKLVDVSSINLNDFVDRVDRIRPIYDLGEMRSSRQRG